MKLYPSNWLYNAGVVGLLRVLNEIGIDVEITIESDGTINLSNILSQNQLEETIFTKWDNLSSKSEKGKNIFYGHKKAYYANQTKESIKRKIKNLFRNQYSRGGMLLKCSFCDNEAPRSKGNFLNQAFGKILLGSEKSFGNMYWNFKSKDFVCPKCEFIIMCHHLALTPLPDGSEIFINAPSFKVMYYLNKYAQSIPKEGKELKHLLGMSLIEFSKKLKAQLGLWTSMNIEVVIKYKYKKDSKKYEEKIDFFSLPSDIVLLLNDYEIANLIYQRGEFKILNMVLDGKFNEILEFSERVFRIALKPKNEWGKHENEFINENVKLERNKNNLISFSQKLFKLYALIEEEIKKEVKI